MEFAFSAIVWEWRGPAPFHFVSVPPDMASEIKEISSAITYGWGMIPVVGKVGKTSFTTSLWAKNGTYAVPLKNAVRREEKILIGDEISIELSLKM